MQLRTLLSATLAAPVAIAVAQPTSLPPPSTPRPNIILPRSAPPNIPTAAEADTLLQGLRIARAGSMSGYDRDLFPHWEIQFGECNTREIVLERDGENVVQDNGSCKAESGDWYSVYDDENFDDASEIDIDHVVPLANAWRSGASDWTTPEREIFANDLINPALIAVSKTSNSQKSDSGPEEWKPDVESYHCTYARMWIKVKSEYELTVREDEWYTLADMLESC